jgi:hypothetical protein
MNDAVARLYAVAMKVCLTIQAIAVAHFVGNPRTDKSLGKLLIRYLRVPMTRSEKRRNCRQQDRAVRKRSRSCHKNRGRRDLSRVLVLFSPNQRSTFAFDDRSIDDNVGYIFAARDVVHHVEHDFFKHRSQRTRSGSLADCLMG